MAQAYVPIQTYTLSSTSASITFTNIPQSYTDLVLKISGRTTTPTSVGESIFISFNGSTSDFSTRVFYGTGSTSGTFTSEARFAGTNNSGGSTTSTFSTTDIYISNYTSSNQKTYGLESVVENNATEGYNYFGSSRWANTSAVTSITLTPNSANAFAINTTATLYGVGGVRATGGTITADSNYTYHTFTSTGSFTALENIKDAQILVIAGGGAGGTNFGGGGGAGGLCYHPGKTLNAGNTYTAIIGAGATAGQSYAQNDGNQSQFAGIVANAGGGGGGSDTGTNMGRSGGSGGGGNRSAAGGSATQTNSGGAIGYGNNGGSSANGFQSGGGGGSGTVGSNGIGTSDGTSKGGAGGDGLNTWSSWAYATNTGVNGFYAGGGGGACRTSSTLGGGAGGSGGGGAGGKGLANGGTAATANTGSGGGAGTDDITGTGNGGSGLVIIRYPN